MSFSPPHILIFILIIPQILASNPLYHICSPSQNFTQNSPYQANLEKLTATLYLQTPPSGFSSSSSGQPPQVANGLALCRGDVPAPNCQACLAEAGSEVRKRCPFNKAAIIWYDNCYYKYSEEAFFGQVDGKNKVYMWNVRAVNDTASFKVKTRELLKQLAGRASGNPRMFETGELEAGGLRKIYGMVQCSRDLRSDVCRACLEGLIGEIEGCCNGKEGGRIIGGSCNFRYEIYPFY